MGELIINRLFVTVKTRLHCLAIDEILLLSCVASLFLPFYICTVTMGITFIYAMYRQETARNVFTSPNCFWFYAFCALGIFTGMIYGHWQGIGILFLLFLLFLFSFYAQSVMTCRLHEYIIRVAAAGSILAMLAACLQKYPVTSYRSVSFFENANYYAYICEIVVVACIYALYRFKSYKWLYIVSVAANIVGILVSGCRTAWLALFFGIAVTMLCLRKYRHLLIFLGFTLLIIVGIIFLPKLIFPRSSQFSSDKALRFLIWENAINMIKSHPLFGEGMFTYFTLSVGRAHDTHAHDIILDILVNFGFVGFSLAAVYAVSTIRLWIKNLSKNTTCVLPLAVCAATLAHGITDVPISWFQTGSLFLLFCALAGIGGAYKIHAEKLTDK